ncbi:MAG: AAA family ATPase [Bacteroidales bacterium]|nr:AAA family ATPase [Bacteroidales bacterium]
MIDRINIRNYKSIKDASVNLHSINVLIGSNGAGKSNFVTFFELVQALLNQRLGNYVLQHGGADRLLYCGIKESKFVDGLIDFGNVNAFSFNLEPSINGKLFINESVSFSNSSANNDKDYTKWLRMECDKAMEESGIIDSCKCEVGYLKNFLSGFTVFHFHDTSLSSAMRRSCRVSDNRFLRHDGSNLPAVLFRLQQSSPKVFRLIEAVIRSVAPYFKRFRLQPLETDWDSIKLEWEEVDTDMYLDAASMSDGTLRFVALATLLLQNNLPDTIVIDEPELGLHPSAINKLAGLLKRASTQSQIVIATQSVNLVNCFEPEDIIVVDRLNNQSVFRRLDSNTLDNWLSDYSLGDIWEKNIIGGQP